MTERDKTLAAVKDYYAAAARLSACRRASAAAP
jgi:hypothetical protein